MSEINVSTNLVTETRPTTFDEVVGLRHNIDMLLYEIRGSKLRGVPLRSFIITGPPGTGKSTLAEIASRESGGQMFKFLGSNIRSPDDIYQIAATSNDGDVIYIEEAHTLGGGSTKAKFCQAILLEWIENFKILGGADITTHAPKVCFVLPTTNPGKLTPALRNRCKILHTSYYSLSEIRQILINAGRKININMESDEAGLRLLAQSSRGTPRIAIMDRLDGLWKMMAVDHLQFSFDTVSRYLEMNHINHWGLEHNDMRYCELLHARMEDNNNRPVSLKTMEQVTGFSTDLVTDIIESYLIQINAIQIESRGRVITPFGSHLIGKDPLNISAFDQIKLNNISEEDLLQALENEKIRSGGIKALCHTLGLKYPENSGIVKSLLHKYGFESKQRVGIIPLLP